MFFVLHFNVGFIQVFEYVGRICMFSNPTTFKVYCSYRWRLFWLNTNWLISWRSSKSLARTLPSETQRTDVWSSSDWCSDPISWHSNEKIREFRALGLTKLKMWIQPFIVS